ncbi:glycosyltransferase [Pseudooceanicola sp. CBS1P-1]|uniref:Glycosyltransferase n=1 Tax=Pseudooceanicola albus TaxID=2692189 RepID=A0A6L7FWU9_9RHOB|nr:MULTISPECIES: glycosyltransferase [Pseudooceanicola]MBT9383994.1 glycosyltransferase [Pseudooceanicola endophyticus]MXN16594.1 glycosyltransferase [Pseudooceanicola albus]
MKILFIHQNFPAQFRHLAPALAARGDQVMALTLRVDRPTLWQGVQILPYALPGGRAQSCHPWVLDLDSQVTRAEACWRAARTLRDQGYAPDVILAHPGWGESLFLADLWPAARLLLYCELYHRPEAPDPEDPATDPEAERLRLRLKNLHNLLQLPQARAGISPTRFQADTFPPPFRARISVIHDGIDTDALCPDAGARLTLPSGLVLDRRDEVVSFANRRLEPCRGIGMFLKSLPELLRARPRAQVVIAGRTEGAAYGPLPPGGTSWKDHYWPQIAPLLPPGAAARVHFPGPLERADFTALLRISRAHVYLTRPFVLSWSLLEALSVAAPVIASDTAPLHEVLTPDTGRLVPWGDPAALAATLAATLADPQRARAMGQAARADIRARYDLTRLCLPAQLAWLDSTA